ncbi:hypothetical protein KIPB_007258, partial [Kipferlia bialata]|eukprot:g7258.t1
MIGAFSTSAERATSANFSQAYFYTNTVGVYNRDKVAAYPDIASVAVRDILAGNTINGYDYSGVTVCLADDTTTYDWVTSEYPDLGDRMVSVEATDFLYFDTLVAGGCDMTVIEEALYKGFTTTSLDSDGKYTDITDS